MKSSTIEGSYLPPVKFSTKPILFKLMNASLKRAYLKCSQNKLACKGVGIGLSVSIVLILLAIIINTELSSLFSWGAFSVVIFCLLLLNLIYLRLIDNLFKKLNNR
ncbi:hypothetical protein QQ020_19700 [Fulvivirgaceae bacterium BMA12]|uniref:Uncharacterized protein n=1 Tax=Agaribacillus aureus TaxID=3051825 RepID=A0ABT8L9G7_9BACT|nr:hypothetical protein [Fulvivirgaceae bacterium BMA12]